MTRHTTLSKVKQERLREEKHRARMWVEVLRKGIGRELCDGYHDWPEDIKGLIDLVNNALVPAVMRMEDADKAYEPFQRFRRRRMYVPRKKVKKVKEKT